MDVINHDDPLDPIGPIDPNEHIEPIDPMGPLEPIEHPDPIEHPGPIEQTEPPGPNEPDAPLGPDDTNKHTEPAGQIVPTILFENIDIINNTLVCYCIRNEKKTKTYVGATNHFCRRIRQHNREIVGGAKATGGYKWHKIILVHGFNTRHDLLSFEWHFKHVVTVNKSGIKRRVEALTKLLSIDRWKMLKFAVIEELQPYF